MGITVESRPAERSEFEAEKRKWKRGAVVFATSTSTRIWIAQDRKHALTVLEQSRDETPELLALRSAEFVRARLLPARTTEQPSPDALPGRKEGLSPTLEFAMGPALLLRSYGGGSLGFGGDASIIWGRTRVGAYVSGALTRAPWGPAPEHFSFRDISAGARVAVELLPLKQTPFSLFALGKLGVATVSVRTESGPSPAQYSARHFLLPLELGARFHYAPNPWFFIGCAVSAGVALPLSRLDAEQASHPPHKKALEEVRFAPSVLGEVELLFGVVL